MHAIGLLSKSALRPLHRHHSTSAGSAIRITAAASKQNNTNQGESSSTSSTLGLGKRIRNVILTSLGAAALAATLSLSPPSISRAEAAAPPASPPVAAVPATMQSKQPIPSAEYLSPEELATVRVFQENTPAVVNVANLIAARTRYSMDVFKIPQGQGSGFIYDTKGHIVTNYHVIRGAAEVQVTLLDQTVWKAKIIGGDPSKDVAVLQLEAPEDVLKNLKPVSLGESSGLFVGQRVLAIGNPFGLDHSLSAGVVSGLNRELATGQGPSLRNVIQTDAAINPGNSGGPLLDSQGRLIGINTAIADPSGKGGSSGVGFAVPIDTVRSFFFNFFRK
jgi:S1-C subfamily serine protease